MGVKFLAQKNISNTKVAIGNQTWNLLINRPARLSYAPHTHIHMHTHAHTHAHTHIHMHTHTRTHTIHTQYMHKSEAKYKPFSCHCSHAYQHWDKYFDSVPANPSDNLQEAVPCLTGDSVSTQSLTCTFSNYDSW